MGRYPAPGFRNRNNGTLYAVGYDEFGWSSSVTAANSYAYDVYFNDSELNPQDRNGHSFGFPVRCLQE